MNNHGCNQLVLVYHDIHLPKILSLSTAGSSCGNSDILLPI